MSTKKSQEGDREEDTFEIVVESLNVCELFKDPCSIYLVVNPSTGSHSIQAGKIDTDVLSAQMSLSRVNDLLRGLHENFGLSSFHYKVIPQPTGKSKLALSFELPGKFVLQLNDEDEPKTTLSAKLDIRKLILNITSYTNCFEERISAKEGFDAPMTGVALEGSAGSCLVTCGGEQLLEVPLLSTKNNFGLELLHGSSSTTEKTSSAIIYDNIVLKVGISVFLSRICVAGVLKLINGVQQPESDSPRLSDNSDSRQTPTVPLKSVRKLSVEVSTFSAVAASSRFGYVSLELDSNLFAEQSEQPTSGSANTIQLQLKKTCVSYLASASLPEILRLWKSQDSIMPLEACRNLISRTDVS